MIYSELAGNLRGRVLAVPDGVGSIYCTLDHMVEIRERAKLDPNLRARMAALLLLLPERDELGEIRAIFEYVRDRVRYLSDVYGVETVAEPAQTLAMGSGDCDDKSLLLATLLEVAGYHAGFIATGYTAPGVYEHVYVLVQLSSGALLPLDPSEKVGIGWQAPDPVAAYIVGV